MSNSSNFKLFRSVIISAVQHVCTGIAGIAKPAGFVSPNKYLTFYERKKLCLVNGISLSDFLEVGIAHLTVPLSDEEKVLVMRYEHSDAYKALIGFVHLHTRTARGAYTYVAEIAGINKNYLRQVVSEHTVCSMRVLDILSGIYGTTYRDLVAIGDIMLKAESMYAAETLIASSISIDAAKVQVPFVPIIPRKDDNLFENVNATMVLCAALNKVLTTLPVTWSVHSLSKQCGVHSDIISRALSFSEHDPHEINFKTHLAIAQGLDIPLFELYRIGIEEYANNSQERTFTKALSSVQDTKDDLLSDREGAVEAYRFVVTHTTNLPIKALISEITGVGFPLLSKILTVNAMPSINALERIAEAFGMSYDELASMGKLSEAEKIRLTQDILLPGKPIQNHLLDRRHIKEVRTAKMSALLNYVKDTYSAKTLSMWSTRANVSSSCVHNIMNRKTYSSNSSINKLARCLDMEGEQLIELGSDLNSKQRDVVIAAKKLLSEKFTAFS